MPQGTVRRTSTNWWAIVDQNEQVLASFDHDAFPFIANGALVNFEEADGDGKAETVESAFDTSQALNQRSGAFMSASLAGALRITPPRGAHNRRARNLAETGSDDVKSATPKYVTAVALLFPVEAATLFPLGKSIAGNDATALAIVIAATVLFVIVLRYFATQDREGDGKPAWNEIWSAVVSLLLWIGATKGYWVAAPDGLLNWRIPPEKGAAIFGFITVMWVALAPYLVKEMANRDADAGPKV